MRDHKGWTFVFKLAAVAMPPLISRGVKMRNLSSQRLKVKNFQKVCSIYCNFEWSKSHLSFWRQIRGQSALNISPGRVRFISNLKPSRAQLLNTLKELNKYASSYVNQSRLQLALRGLEQKCGEETIRIAVLCVAGRNSSFQRAKQIIQLLLADPLKTQEKWEQFLLSKFSQALLLIVGPEPSVDTLKENNFVQELHVSSPLLNGQRIEILVMESDLPTNRLDEEISLEAFLVPSVKIPSSDSGRYSIIRTPVHRTLLISEGLLGAINLLKIPIDFHRRDIIETAIDFTVPDCQKSSIPSNFIDVALAAKALESFREHSSNISQFETSWSLSGLPKIQSWLQQGIISTSIGMNVYLQSLIGSLLEDTMRAIEDEEAQLFTKELSKKVSQNDITRLHEELKNWASRSHSELQDKLELAFEGKRWHKLIWWKLFWRVDDITLVASEILNEHFLLNAEQEAVFLAGRIAECGFSEGRVLAPLESCASEGIDDKISKAQLGEKPQPPQVIDFISSNGNESQLHMKNQCWPKHITAARLYLSQLKIPPLQALGQRLVIQTICTSLLASTLSGLAFISSASLDLYEVGVMASLGILFGLRRMQRTWENTRDIWKEEVREEGRIALISVEAHFKTFLTTNSNVPEFEEIKNAKAAVLATEKALLACK